MSRSANSFASSKPTKRARKHLRWFRAWLKDGTSAPVQGLDPNDAYDRLPPQDKVQVKEIVEMV